MTVKLPVVQYLLADSFRKNGRLSYLDVLSGFLFSRTHRIVITLRLCQLVDRKGIFYKLSLQLCKALHRISCHLAGVDFPWRTEIGPGFAITHGWSLVVNEGTTIGANVTIFHGVTIGRADRLDQDGVRTSAYPVIEDEVWIGPHAILVGGITIGRGSRIAGGAFVNKDVPPYSLVVGNPSAVVKHNVVPDVFNMVHQH